MKQPIKDINDALRKQGIKIMVKLLIVIAVSALFLLLLLMKNETIQWIVAFILLGVWAWRFVDFFGELPKTRYLDSIFEEIQMNK